MSLYCLKIELSSQSEPRQHRFNLNYPPPEENEVYPVGQNPVEINNPVHQGGTNNQFQQGEGRNRIRRPNYPPAPSEDNEVNSVQKNPVGINNQNRSPNRHRNNRHHPLVQNAGLYNIHDNRSVGNNNRNRFVPRFENGTVILSMDINRYRNRHGNNQTPNSGSRSPSG